MNENILLYDVFDNKNVLNSQVILNKSIGFEIPSDCYFDKNATNFDKHIFQLINHDNNINIHFDIYNENSYKEKIDKIRNQYKITEEFVNYRGQKIIEYENESGINIIVNDDKNILSINSKCNKYSFEYYVLYYIAFSFDSNCDDNYENSYYQKNSYCILKNAKHLYDEYNVNLIKHNPFETLKILNNENFCKYLINNSDYDDEINNYYLMKDNASKNIVNRIKNYKNDEFDDPSLMDLIEE